MQLLPQQLSLEHIITLHYLRFPQMIKSKFKYGDRVLNMELGYRLAQTTLADLGLDVLSITTEGNQVIQTIMLNDRTMLKVWYHYVQEETGHEFMEALDILDSTPEGLEGFKQAFWDMVVGFSPQPVREALQELWKQGKKELKGAAKQISNISSSASSVEQD